jgi:hypothetical protein
MMTRMGYLSAISGIDLPFAYNNGTGGFLTQALQLHRRTGNRLQEGLTRKYLGLFFIKSGNDNQALQYFDSAFPFENSSLLIDILPVCVEASIQQVLMVRLQRERKKRFPFLFANSNAGESLVPHSPNLRVVGSQHGNGAMEGTLDFRK